MNMIGVKKIDMSVTGIIKTMMKQLKTCLIAYATTKFQYELYDFSNHSAKNSNFGGHFNFKIIACDKIPQTCCFRCKKRDCR